MPARSTICRKRAWWRCAIPTRHDVRMSYPFRPEMHDWSVSSVQFNAGLEDTTFRGPGHLLGGS